MNGKYQRLYKKAKNIMQDKTPLKKDCGQLCGKACCKGDTETGMLLFPFEENSLPVTEKTVCAFAFVTEAATEGKDRFPV